MLTGNVSGAAGQTAQKRVVDAEHSGGDLTTDCPRHPARERLQEPDVNHKQARS
jgi:hypothetical protein